jgi:hypothetical protein
VLTRLPYTLVAGVEPVLFSAVFGGMLRDDPLVASRQPAGVG